MTFKEAPGALSAPLPTDELSRDICAAVDRQFQQQVEFTQSLIRYPSERGNEHTAQEFMFTAMRERGLAMDRWAIDVESIAHHPGFSPVDVSYENAVNVVGTHHPANVIGHSLILNGHIDVVPTGPTDMWSVPPYEPRVVDGWLHGRGSGDMKAGLGVNLFAFDALRSVGFEPGATVYFQSVTEEECTGNGALSCLVRGYRADAVVITEPTDDALTRANVGVLWLKIEVRGRPAHVLESYKGSNAIDSMFRVIQRLKALEDELNAETVEHPRFADAQKPITINVGKIKGGDWASSVPSWCEIDVRMGIYPGVSVDAAKARIERAVRAACHDDPMLSNHPPSITYNGFAAEGYVLEEGSDAEACLAWAHQAIYQRSLDSVVTPAYLDARVFALYDDTPSLVYGPLCERIHGFDERVNLDSIKTVTKTIALFVARWCGLNPLTDDR